MHPRNSFHVDCERVTTGTRLTHCPGIDIGFDRLTFGIHAGPRRADVVGTPVSTFLARCLHVAPSYRQPVAAVNPLPYAGRSDTGRRRSANQDRWGADVDQGLFVVADGVATSSNGELAAQMATELLPAYLRRHLTAAGLDDADAADRLGRAVGELSDDVHARGLADAGSAGANSTVVAAVITGSRALVAYLGDSRAYLWRDRGLRLLTRDHSVIQELINRGEITAAEGAKHLARGVLTRHVGMAPPARPDTVEVELHPGDRILLCSDGLHGVVDEAALAEILGAQRDPSDASDALIAAANAAGGPDNITVIVADIPAVAQAAGATT